ncbi:sulfurtransferase [Paenibacillus tuaregi]|uniref:sulfurtransferase n=1 Tax=Paenibacillus tuaregi TaxID=1816681 RepID=UPI0008397FC9|nr:sulfurtransferase [Paenibacillus tuaregi]
MSTIVAKNWLLARLYDHDLVIVDCRFQLDKPEAGRQAYEAGHIPGAVYLDLEADLSGPVGPHGGRHPLPDMEQLAQRLGEAGIGPDSRVVAYDDQGGMYAARLWWLLRYAGHEHVHVLGEGFSAWQAAGYPVTAETRVVIPQTFVAHPQRKLWADVSEVHEASAAGDAGALLVDSREAKRYIGEEEPMDARAGHIPGAANRFWKGVLDEHGAWKSAEQLREYYPDIIQAAEAGRDVIVYCGSGVSACPNVLALHELGLTKVKLYPGSWSDWISYPENPVATGEE